MNKNILLIICDQFRWDCLSAMGHSVVDTPNLDTLANAGTFFRNAYAPAPSCIAARASLFTGKNPSNHGFLGYEDCHEWNFENMLAEVLRNGGYQTHCVGKTHFYPQRKHCGFEGLESCEGCQTFNGNVSDYREWLREKTGGRLSADATGIDDNGWVARPSALPEDLHNSSWVVTKGLEFMRRRDKTRPYFLNLSFHRPHPPIDPPQVFWDMYKDREWNRPAVGDWAAKHDKPVRSAVFWEGHLDDERMKTTRLGYYAQIAHIDNLIGRLIKELQYLDDMPDYIIFTSDHGEMLGDHHLFRKTYAYEGSAAVPLIVWEKGLDKREVRDDAVLLQDIYPTILNLADIEIPSGVDGLDLFKENDREFVHGEHAAFYHDDEGMQFLTDGKIKYIWFTNTGEEQLFDLIADPYECVNLSNKEEYRDRLKHCRTLLIKELEKRPHDRLAKDGKLMSGILPNYREACSNNTN